MTIGCEMKNRGTTTATATITRVTRTTLVAIGDPFPYPESHYKGTQCIRKPVLPPNRLLWAGNVFR